MPQAALSPTGYSIRAAHPEDLPVLLSLILELARYENRQEAVTASIEDLRYWLFEQGAAQALIGEWEGTPVSYAIVYPVFSSFRGKASLHVEDVYVQPRYRGRGFGKALFAGIARLALHQGYACLYWCCLDWNQPSIQFYQSLGARTLHGTTDFALDTQQMQKLARYIR